MVVFVLRGEEESWGGCACVTGGGGEWGWLCGWYCGRRIVGVVVVVVLGVEESGGGGGGVMGVGVGGVVMRRCGGVIWGGGWV